MVRRGQDLYFIDMDFMRLRTGDALDKRDDGFVSAGSCQCSGKPTEPSTAERKMECNDSEST
jgi:hypothetical protein